MAVCNPWDHAGRFTGLGKTAPPAGGDVVSLAAEEMNESRAQPAGPPYVVDPDVLRPYDEKRTVFARRRWDEAFRRSLESIGAEVAHHGADGPSRALDRAAGGVRELLVDRFFGAADDSAAQGVAGADGERAPGTAAENTALVKSTARAFGAALVGVCRLNRSWLYAGDGEGRARVPESLDWAVVFAVAMDPGAIRTSPGPGASAATRVGYMRAAICGSGLSEFLRNLGYRAVASLNDVGLNIPLAVDAGLGEMGRNGMLIVPGLGPCVRIAKVFTDLPLEPDPPVDLALRDRCRRCRLCATACTAGAIDSGPEPTFAPACASNNPGVLRWPVDGEKCFRFWHANGTSCSNCVAACPLTPPGAPQ